MEHQVSVALSQIKEQLLQVKQTKDSFLMEQTGYIPMSVLQNLQRLDSMLENLEEELKYNARWGRISEVKK